MKETTLLTVNEVLEMLRISRSTLNRMRKRGDIPAHKVGKSVRFARDDIDEFLRRTRQTGDE